MRHLHTKFRESTTYYIQNYLRSKKPGANRVKVVFHLHGWIYISIILDQILDPKIRATCVCVDFLFDPIRSDPCKWKTTL